ncbi:hypothetical protein FA15DRAFT_224466 [Coprinopsis marcescibilis]|uniref:Uncharacterized protein n=1 Tax=Coprinopsis marcescibilis TaxID=230819 RepID=A0A5C3KGD1_COPMA|nr:hypothetical protein FA15DRAFT_224466 [Coprinopsis marcescibilis]
MDESERTTDSMNTLSASPRNNPGLDDLKRNRYSPRDSCWSTSAQIRRRRTIKPCNWDDQSRRVGEGCCQLSADDMMLNLNSCIEEMTRTYQAISLMLEDSPQNPPYSSTPLNWFRSSTNDNSPEPDLLWEYRLYTWYTFSLLSPKGSRL